MTVLDVLRQLSRAPGDLLLRKWNWKSAVFSSLIRADVGRAEFVSSTPAHGGGSALDMGRG